MRLCEQLKFLLVRSLAGNVSRLYGCTYGVSWRSRSESLKEWYVGNRKLVEHCLCRQNTRFTTFKWHKQTKLFIANAIELEGCVEGGNGRRETRTRTHIHIQEREMSGNLNLFLILFIHLLCVWWVEMCSVVRLWFVRFLLLRSSEDVDASCKHVTGTLLLTCIRACMHLDKSWAD